MRPPGVFVRSLAHVEATALKGRAKKAKHFATRERAAILLASSVGNSVPQIAQMWMTDESHVRRVIHEFNERGMASLDPEYRGGRPRRITAEERQGGRGGRCPPRQPRGRADAVVAAQAGRPSGREWHCADQSRPSRPRAERGRPVVSAHAYLEG